MERAWETVYDDILQEPIKQAKQKPVLIVYKYQGKRFEKSPDTDDFRLLEEIQQKYEAHTEAVDFKYSKRTKPAVVLKAKPVPDGIQ